MRYFFFAGLFALLSSCGTTVYYHKTPPRPGEKRDTSGPALSPAPTKSSEFKKANEATIEAVDSGKPNVNSGSGAETVVSQPARPQIQTAPVLSELEQLKSHVDKSVSVPNQLEQEQYKAKAIQMVDNFSISDLQKIVRDSDYGYIRPYALMRLGELAQRERDYGNAKKYFSTVIEFVPESDLAIKARTIISNIDGLKNVNARSVGLILPLTGKNKAIGDRVLKAIRMGLSVDDPNSNLQLTVLDDEGNPELARAAVERLVKENNVVTIIGGLLSKEAAAIAQKAEEYGVPTITLSQKAGLTDIGSSIFRHALTSEMQVRQLVKHAMTNLEIKKFAIVFPNDNYGVEFANLFWDEVLARGGEVTAVQTYGSDEKDFNNLVQRMVGTYYPEGRADELEVRTRLQKAQQAKDKDKKRNTRDHVDGEDLLPPIVDFDAVFIPDTSKALSQIASFFNFNNVKDVKFLGPNIWNTPEITKRAKDAGADIVFVDAVDLASPQVQSSPFFVDYKTKFNEEPSLLEIQSFEAAQMAKAILSQRSQDRNALQSALSTLKNFSGVTGPLTMSENREVLRPLVTFGLVNGVLTSSAKSTQ